jgi:hypothetical protein
LARSRGEECRGESGIILTWSVPARSSGAQSGLAAGKKDQRAPDLEPEHFMDLKPAVVFGGSASARIQLDAAEEWVHSIEHAVARDVSDDPVA